jgi:23S rRNA (uracil1939-C5)-methyltransferase
MSERLTIAHLAHRGDGVAETPDGPVYVPYTLPGETVEAERVPGHPDRRHLLRVVEASAERIEPICPHFGVCGGCAVQHWATDRYLEWKHGLVVAALAQAGLEAPVDALIDAHGQGRRRVTLHARSSHAPSTTRDIGAKRRRPGSEFLEVGFATLRAHTLVGIDHCPVLAPALDGAINAAWAVAEVLEPTRKPLDIQITATDAGLDVDVRGSGALDATYRAALAKVAQAHRLARLTRHGELVAQQTAPTMTIGRASVTLPPGGFLQATAAGEAALAELMHNAIADAKNIADLFCGVGPFALRFAERARVAAFDQDAETIAALTQAARATAGLKPIEATARDLFRRPLVAQELKRFDAVVFDPPRQGAQAQAGELARSDVPVVVAVSCNPATLARDLKLLVDGGYRLTRVTPVDQFRYSPHVEVVAKLER